MIAEVWGAIFSILMAFVFHFLYQWSGESPLIAPFAAVNESVWEHTKILFVPYLLFALLEYALIKPTLKRYLVAKAAGLLFVNLAVIVFFYTYSGILGYNLLWVDIGSAILWAALAYLVSYRLLINSKPIERHARLASVISLALMFGCFAFTFRPPHINLFLDTTGGFFGIR